MQKELKVILLHKTNLQALSEVILHILTLQQNIIILSVLVESKFCCSLLKKCFEHQGYSRSLEVSHGCGYILCVFNFYNVLTLQIYVIGHEFY